MKTELTKAEEKEWEELEEKKELINKRIEDLRRKWQGGW